MKLICASDSFKGSLSSERIGELLGQAAREAFPSVEFVPFRMADGGEGTLEAIRAVRSGEYLPLYVHDARMRPLRSGIFLCGDEAFVEAASTCGLAKLDTCDRNPLETSSYGVGECISHALAHRCTNINVGLGGSCTNDGGMGCLRALGVRFFDEDGNELVGFGADLARVARIDESGLYPLVHEATFTIMSDVTNPLLGPNGATYVFGPQKGAGSKMLERLESGMAHFTEVIAATHPNADFDTPGYGAAGGLGMALSVFLGAQMASGVEEVLAAVGFDSALEGADLVVTGEGQLDEQSLQGKVVSGVVAHARNAGVPVAALCGSIALGSDRIAELGLALAEDISEGQTQEYAMAHAEENYLRAARTLFNGLAAKRAERK